MALTISSPRYGGSASNMVCDLAKKPDKVCFTDLCPKNFHQNHISPLKDQSIRGYTNLLDTKYGLIRPKKSSRVFAEKYKQ